MSVPLVGKVWWQDQRDAVHEHLLRADSPATFGRHADADIRIGHGPEFDAVVPRRWGTLTWSRGRLHVSNVDDRWGFDLVPQDETNASRMTVIPQAIISPPSVRFAVVAEVPGHRFVLQVACARPGRVPDGASGPTDTPSTVPFALTDGQVVVGKAIITLLRQSPKRPAYHEIAEVTHYSSSGVRSIIAKMDEQFLTHGLVRDDERGNALDRVAAVVSKHSGLLR